MQEIRISIRNEFLRFQQISFVDQEYLGFFALLKAKTENLPLRGYFAKKVFDYILEECSVELTEEIKDLFPGKIPFIMEMIITIQYYHNQILDGKGGVYTMDRVKQNLILGNLLKEHFYDYVNEVCTESAAKIITKYVRKIFQYTDLGQYIEKNYNTYDVYVQNRNLILPFEHQVNKFVNEESINFLLQNAHKQVQLETRLPFLELYFKRVYLVSSSLFRLTVEMIGALCGDKMIPETINSTACFAEYYGLMMQLVNDNCDWVPEVHGHKTVAKKTDDAFSDLKNRNVTYPLFLYLESEYSDNSIKDFLEGYADYIPDVLQEAYFNKMIDSGVMKKSLKLANKVAQESLKSLNPQNQQYEIFEDMVKIAQYNRYYYHIRKAEKKVRNLQKINS